MNNIDNRPKILGTVTAFRENNLPVKVEIEQEIDFAAEEVKVEIWDAYKFLYSVTSFTIDEHNVYVQLTREQVKALPTLAKCQVIIRDYYTFGYNIIAELGFGQPIGNNFKVSIDLKGPTGDITPEAAALALQINNQASQVSFDTESASLSAISTASDRQIVVSKAQEVEEAREEIIAGKRMRIATFAAMIALIQQNKPRDFTVVNDERFGLAIAPDKDNIPYSWDGEVLLFYGLTPCDIQPTF